MIGSQPRIRDDRLPECVEGRAGPNRSARVVSIRGEVRSVNERLAEHSGAPPVNSMPLCFFHLEGESEAKISLYKVVV